MASKQRVALVTGAAQGLGAAICTALARAGWSVAVTDQNEVAAEKLAESLTQSGFSAQAWVMSVESETQISKVGEAVLSRWGHIDQWVNNAGIMPLGAFSEAALEQLEATWRVNFWGDLLGMRWALQQFQTQGQGHLINISSITAKVPLPGAAVYSATKAALFEEQSEEANQPGYGEQINLGLDLEPKIASI